MTFFSFVIKIILRITGQGYANFYVKPLSLRAKRNGFAYPAIWNNDLAMDCFATLAMTTPLTSNFPY
jgi:hypothetical protein